MNWFDFDFYAEAFFQRNVCECLTRRTYNFWVILFLEFCFFTNKIISAKYIVLSNIICIVSDNLLRICIHEILLISKKFICCFSHV